MDAYDYFLLMTTLLDSNYFAGVVDMLAQDSGENHLDILYKTVVAIVVAVQTNLVGVDNIIVVPNRNLLVGHNRKIRRIGKISHLFILPGLDLHHKLHI